MRDVYRKVGRSVRFEHSRGGDALVLVDEAGEAFFDDDDAFRTRPRAGDEMPGEIDPQPAIDLAEWILDAVPRQIEVERLALSTGASRHSLGEGGDVRTWSDSTARLHVSLVHRRAGVRILVDLGGASVGALNPSTVPLIAESLAALRPSTPAPGCIELAPVVTAQILRPLLATAAAADARTDRAIRFLQSPQTGWLDGNGQQVDEVVVASFGSNAAETAPLRNVYRPSYRSIPAKQAMHLDIEFEGVAPETECQATAIALASAPVVYGDRVAFDALATEGEESFLVAIDLSAAEWLRSISTIDDRRMWFPAGAGAWGRRLALRRI